MPEPLRLRVVIPHFFREGASPVEGYGSGRSGNRLARSLALARCLAGVLSLNRAEQDWILNMAEQQLERSPSLEQSAIEVELHLFVCGDHWLQEVVELFAPRLQLHRFALDDPMQLPLHAVRTLLHAPSPAAFNLYLEDDLVVQDPAYVDKLAWFHRRTDYQFVLMPHRLEYTVANAPQRLFVDGPIKPLEQTTPVWANEEAVVAHGRFQGGQEVGFVQASNPHSGSFCVSASQLLQLQQAPWPPAPFVGPLETAATGTVLGHFPVLKPSWACRHFFSIEHGNPSFLGLMSRLPQRDHAAEWQR